MKKYFIVPVILSLSMLSWAQEKKDLFDVKKSGAELEIMKGILSTTISYAAQSEHKNTWRLNTSGMNACYLAGQGAVFLIPTATFRSMELTPFLNGQDINLDLDLSNLKEQMHLLALKSQKLAAENESRIAELYQRELGAGSESGTGSGTGSGKGNGSPPQPPAPPAPPQPPAPPAPPQIDLDQIRKRVEEYKQGMNKSREEAAAKQAKFLKSLEEISSHLIEALANYGDSLTQVKSGEYINLIFQTDLFDADLGRTKTQYNIISAQKSWITDYKAGRITLDNFKQKVLQYTE
jgi:hypothetical protein